MNKRTNSDEEELIDFVLDQSDHPDEISQRLKTEPQLRKTEQDIRNAMSALGALSDVDEPQDLVERTMQRVRMVRQTNELLARQQVQSRRFVPTFSFRELLAMAAMVLIMVGVFVPSVRHARQKAIASQCASNAGQIGSGLLTYANSSGDSLPSIDGQNWLGKTATSNSAALFKLVKSGFTSPSVFQCPATGAGTFVCAAGMVDFPEKKFIGYSYQYSLQKGLNRSEPALAAQAEKMAVLADNNPIFCDGEFKCQKLNAQASDNHDGGGQNVLYLPGNVEWATNPNVGVNGDNIFLADQVTNYTGNEKPSGPTDSFLLPYNGGN